MEGDKSVEFTLPARAENVALVRHALSGFAEVLGMDAGEIADLKTVVTEACTNVVAHAYEPGTEGTLEVGAGVDGDGEQLVVTIRDFGRGIRPLADVERRSLRLGLPLIAALSAGFSVETTPGGGTTVSVRMPLLAETNGGTPAQAPQAEDQTQINIDAGAILAPVLSRVISMFASRADFSVDRLSDAVLLSDAISAGGPQGFPGGTARLTVSEETGAFEVRIGPLGDGGGERLLTGMRIPELGGSLESLAEEVRVDADGAGEYVFMRISASE